MQTPTLPKTSGIYKITCTANGKIYVGSAKKFRSRWDSHRSEANHQKHHSPPFQNSWNKYEESAFVFEIIEECNLHNLIQREQHYIDTTDCLAPKGFNICPTAGSCLGTKRSPEQVVKMSERMKGKPKSIETRAKMSEVRKGRKRSPETSAKIALAKRGKKLSSAHVAKISKGNCKYVYIVITPENKQIIVYNLHEFCQKYDLNQGAMSGVANGKRPQHKGYKVRRIERDSPTLSDET